MLTGYAPADNRCLPCSGVTGRTVAPSSYSTRSDQIICSQVKIVSMKCVSRETSIVCRAGSSGRRRNPDFSRNKHGFRGRNRHNEDRESFENHEEPEMLSSKNGPLLSMSNSPKYQATAAPGPREREIVELFRKVQAQLRERAAVKGEKRVEASRGKGKESETVDSLLKLLRKHSVEQGKSKSTKGSQRDLNLDPSTENGQYNEDKSSSFFSASNRRRIEEAKESAPTLSRPASNFRRKSPVPQLKYHSIYSREGTVNSKSDLNLDRGTSSFESSHEPEQVSKFEPEPEEELDSESEPEPGLESVYEDPNIFDELSEDESTDAGDDDNDLDEEKEQIAHEDLSALKLPELRALAKSRGLKGFSKMKKGDLVELLSGSAL